MYLALISGIEKGKIPKMRVSTPKNSKANPHKTQRESSITHGIANTNVKTPTSCQCNHEFDNYDTTCMILKNCFTSRSIFKIQDQHVTHPTLQISKLSFCHSLRSYQIIVNHDNEDGDHCFSITKR